jgi:hypothetical protein
MDILQMDFGLTFHIDGVCFLADSLLGTRHQFAVLGEEDPAFIAVNPECADPGNLLIQI